MDNHIQELLDRAEISEIRAHWAHALDVKDWDFLPILLTDDVHVDFTDFGMPPQTVPKQMLVDSFKSNLSRPGLATQHLFTNIRITIEGDTAKCISHFTGYHSLAGADGGEEFTIRGEYTDTLVKTEGGWRVSSIACKLFAMTGNPQLLTA